MVSALCCDRNVEKSPGMPSTWSKGPCVNGSRSSLRKPAPLRSNWRWLPSPQSTRMRVLPASTRRPGWLRSADGTLAEVPRNVTANMIGAELSFGWRGCHDAGPKTYVPNEILPHFLLKKTVVILLLLVVAP